MGILDHRWRIFHTILDIQGYSQVYTFQKMEAQLICFSHFVS